MDKATVIKALSPRALAFLKEAHHSSTYFEARKIMPAIKLQWSYAEADKIVTELEKLGLVSRSKAPFDIIGDITEKGSLWMEPFESRQQGETD